jgi:hypothetical protein
MRLATGVRRRSSGSQRIRACDSEDAAVKLKRVVLEGFRGAPVEVEFGLGEKSLCPLAEDGHGKTTLVDGLEFWSSRDVDHYHCGAVRARRARERGFPRGPNYLRAALAAGRHANAHRLTPSELAPAGPMVVGSAPPTEQPRHRERAVRRLLGRHRQGQQVRQQPLRQLVTALDLPVAGTHGRRLRCPPRVPRSRNLRRRVTP